MNSPRGINRQGGGAGAARHGAGGAGAARHGEDAGGPRGAGAAAAVRSGGGAGGAGAVRPSGGAGAAPSADALMKMSNAARKKAADACLQAGVARDKGDAQKAQAESTKAADAQSEALEVWQQMQQLGISGGALELAERNYSGCRTDAFGAANYSRQARENEAARPGGARQQGHEQGAHRGGGFREFIRRIFR